MPDTPATAVNRIIASNNIAANQSILAGPEAVLAYVPEGLRKNVSANLIGGRSPSPVSISFEPDINEQVKESVPGVQKLSNQQPAAGFASLVRTANSGLVAASTSIELVTFAASGKEVATMQLPVGDEVSLSAFALYGDIAVIVYDTDTEKRTLPNRTTDIQRVTAVNLQSRTELWSRLVAPTDGGPGTCDSTFAGLREESLDVSANGDVVFGGDDALVAVDPKSGVVRWSSPIPRCFLGSVRPIGDYPVHILSYNGLSVVDMRQGRNLADGIQSVAIDQKENLLAISFVDPGLPSANVEPGLPSLRVVDSLTGSVVFELPAEQGLKLGQLNVIGAYDGRVWIRTSDGVDIVDARTGMQDPSSPARQGRVSNIANIPVGLGDSWMLIADAVGDNLSVLSIEGVLEFDQLPVT